MILTMPILTEYIVENSILNKNINILYILEVGIIRLLHGIQELESLSKMYLGHIFMGMELLHVGWILWLLHTGKMINFSNGMVVKILVSSTKLLIGMELKYRLCHVSSILVNLVKNIRTWLLQEAETQMK